MSIVHVTHGLSPLANINKTQATRLDRDLTNLTRATLALVDPTLKEKTLHVQRLWHAIQHASVNPSHQQWSVENDVCVMI